MQRPTIFGEVLFDRFPSGDKVLGGAPFNVAWHLQAFGRRPRFVSRVGDDAEGREIFRAMEGWGMDSRSLQTDDTRATGEVRVTLHDGEPSYDIIDDVAYDFIDPEQLDDAPCGMLYHGSLALRNEVSRRALEKLKSLEPSAVFMDVNLRDPWWRRDQVLSWIGGADWVKLNETEFTLLHGSPGDDAGMAMVFLNRHHLKGLVLTRGAKGALAVASDRPPVEVTPIRVQELVDTVGAGDAFSSVLLLGLSLGWPLRRTLDRAQTFASALVGRRGATVEDADFYRPFIEAWNLSSTMSE